MALLEKKYTLDVDGVVKTRFINGTMPVLVADSQTRKSEIDFISTYPGGFPKVAKNGVWVDPTKATKNDGEKFLAEIVRNLAKECQS